MAIEFTVTHHFSQPPDRVYAALTDLDSAKDWMPGFVRLERVAGSGFQPGTEWRETRKMFGREATEQFEVTSCEPPARIGLRVDGTKGASRRGEYIFDYRITPKAGGSEVTLRGEIRGLGGLASLVGKLMSGPFRKACAKDLQALDDWLTARGTEH